MAVALAVASSDTRLASASEELRSTFLPNRRSGPSFTEGLQLRVWLEPSWVRARSTLCQNRWQLEWLPHSRVPDSDRHHCT
eukprot:772535-Amphidinium_carterae.1